MSPRFFGVVNENAFWNFYDRREAILAQTAATGARTLRQTFDWALIEKQPGIYSFDFYDKWMADASRADFDQLAVLFNPPAFRSSRRAGDSRGGTFPPSGNEGFARFADAVVRRYGPGGSFWAENPDVPPHPVREWQIWNEPNTRAYWPTGPNPAAYVAMLRTVGQAIRAVDPGAEIITAGLPQSRKNMAVGDFLAGMYRAGGKGAFDTVAVHPYATSAEDSYEIVAALREVMDTNGDGSAGIRVTEIGWASQGPDSPFSLDESGQAREIGKVFNQLVDQASALKLRGISYFNWQDAKPYAPAYRDFWGLHTGLLAIDGREKPAYSAFRNSVLRLTGPVSRRRATPGAR